MAKRKRKNLWLFILIGLVVLLIAGAVWKGSQKPKGERVFTEVIEKRTIKEMVSASGKIYPEKEVKISSDVSGEIVNLFVEEGDSVVSGQLLAKIDPDAYQSQVERGEAAVNSAKAQVANSRSGIEQAIASREQILTQIDNARKIHDRNTQLLKDGVISEADFEQSEASLKGLEANLRSSEASKRSAEEMAKSSEFSVKSAEASLKELKTLLKRTTLYAPNNGIVTALNVEKGERVVGTMQMQGTELMRISNLNAMEVQVDVSENDVLRVSINDEVEIEVDAYLDRKFKGIVTEIANSAKNLAAQAISSDQVTNFVVKIRIDASSYSDLSNGNTRYPFRPGMSASVDINTLTLEDVIAVPIQAVTTRDKEKPKGEKEEDKKKKKDEDEDEIREVVFLMNGDSAKLVEVKTGIQDDDYIEIKSGLSGGEEVIAGPYNAISRKLKDGKIVQEVEESKFYGGSSSK